ncbi:protease complex subunit PrcB family protein [Alkaliphilus pronyensis]|uniref:Protease complex subunit PrcB family protein n=1 Tax=Alkaliphilus pronyensis TaxID=1482732 RepID=A0A6I0F2S8_9FIRM|nr:protease complex subunit PrcB family protein [Alkaliphilus pronyensis]KAB3536327.1 protease complex subunit PrcB family protein [Alkaliphilus pronyensis]
MIPKDHRYICAEGIEEDITYKVWNMGEKKIKVQLFWGEKPNRGYKIRIRDVVIDGDKIKVSYKKILPKPDSVYSQVISYPCDSWDGNIEDVYPQYLVELQTD